MARKLPRKCYDYFGFVLISLFVILGWGPRAPTGRVWVQQKKTIAIPKCRWAFWNSINYYAHPKLKIKVKKQKHMMILYNKKKEHLYFWVLREKWAERWAFFFFFLVNIPFISLFSFSFFLHLIFVCNIWTHINISLNKKSPSTTPSHLHSHSLLKSFKYIIIIYINTPYDN